MHQLKMKETSMPTTKVTCITVGKVNIKNKRNKKNKNSKTFRNELSVWWDFRYAVTNGILGSAKSYL
jgi:hypothetical protein